MLQIEKKSGPPFSASQVREAQDAVSAAPKGPSGYPLDSSMHDLYTMIRENRKHRNFLRATHRK